MGRYGGQEDEDIVVAGSISGFPALAAVEYTGYISGGWGK